MLTHVRLGPELTVVSTERETECPALRALPCNLCKSLRIAYGNRASVKKLTSLEFGQCAEIDVVVVVGLLATRNLSDALTLAHVAAMTSL